MPSTTSSQDLPAVKEKRRNSEKRKEKSRDAARSRRSKETEIFIELSDQLPLPQNILSQMDKASLMRLAISFIKIRCFIDPRLEVMKSTPSTTFDSYYLKSLNGFLLVMSKEGDMIYLSENISDYLGLSQADLMGNSIFDYTHPCDHDDLKELLSLKPKEPDLSSIPFSVFIRMKNTLTSKGRNLTVRSASYKVIHCTGQVLTKAPARIEKCKEDVEETENCFLTIGEPIPHPSNIEVPLGKLTFLSRHSLDMKFTYVDERIVDVLGYTSKELLGKSVYYFYHASDCTFLEKSYKILFAKGQCETNHYRFLAKYGGYVWVLTQATIIYEGSSSKPQCVVCVNYVLSEREQKNEIVSEEQTSPAMPEATDDYPLLPQASTNKIFAPRTADMNTGFLTFLDDDSGLIVSKDEPEDLTHLAPQAGDACIALDMSGVCSGLFDDVLLDDCNDNSLLLSGYECLSEKNIYTEDRCSMADYLVTNSKSSLLNKDPFLSTRDDPLLSSDSNKYLLEQSTNGSRGASLLQRKVNKSTLSSNPDVLMEKITFSRDDTEKDDYALRAPYIPMSDVDDYLLLSSPESLLLETKQSSNNTYPSTNAKNITRSEPVTKTYSSESVKSNLAKLLKGELRRQRINVPAKPVTVADKASLVVRKNASKNTAYVREASLDKVNGKSRTVSSKGRANQLKDKVIMDRKQKKVRAPMSAIPDNHRTANERLSKNNRAGDSVNNNSAIRCLPLQPMTIENKQPFPQPPDPPPKRNGSGIPGPQDSPKKIKMDPKINSGSQKSVLLNLLVNGEDASHGYYCQHAQLNKYKLPSNPISLNKVTSLQQNFRETNGSSNSQPLIDSMLNIVDSSSMDLPALI